MSEFHFLRPWFLLALPLAGLFYYWFVQQVRNSEAWQQVIAPELLKHLVDKQGAKRSFRVAMPLAVSAWCIACLAMAGPSWQKTELPINQQDNALILILDLSLSMYAEDEKPSRLLNAKRKISDILDLRKEGLTALIAYSGDAHWVVPLTEDGHTIKHLLPALEPIIMPKFGSNLSAALTLAQQQLDLAQVQHADIVLLTDEIGKKDRQQVVKILNQPQQLNILTFGSESGAPIPIPQQGFLKDGNTTVLAKLPYADMQRWAKQQGIRLQKSRLDNQDIAYIEHLSGDLRETEQRQAIFWQDNGYYLVWLLLPIALLAFRRGVLL